MRSATRMGWLKLLGSSTTPCPMRMRSVRMAQAVSQISGAEELESSSRK